MRNFKKISAAALAAVLAAGSVSAVSFAETTQESATEPTWTDENGVTWKDPFEIRENSKYEISIDKAEVNGEEKVAVKLSGLPEEMFTYKYDFRKEEKDEDGEISFEELEFRCFGITIDIGAKFLIFTSKRDLNGEAYCNICQPSTPAFCEYSYTTGYFQGMKRAEGSPSVDAQIVKENNMISLIAYLDPDDALTKKLITLDNTTVFSGVFGSRTTGTGSLAGSFVNVYHYISSDGTIRYCDDAKPWSERVKITNNLSDPADTPVIPGATDKPAEQETISATLKGVDSKNGLSGAELEKQLFGDSGWTWAQTEKVEFSSDKLFSVQYTAADGSTKTLGETAARAEDDGIWNTAWTLDASLMSKDKPSVKLLAKDGTADITAKVYIKKDAKKPTGEDQKSTGIALAIAPVVLAAGAVIVVSKKRK